MYLCHAQGPKQLFHPDSQEKGQGGMRTAHSAQGPSVCQSVQSWCTPSPSMSTRPSQVGPACSPWFTDEEMAALGDDILAKVPSGELQGESSTPDFSEGKLPFRRAALPRVSEVTF